MRRKAGALRAVSYLALGLAFCTGPAANAQTTIAPLVDGDDAEFKIDPITAGSLKISPVITATTRYDSNVLAEVANNEVDDLELIVRPEVGVEVGEGDFRLNFNGFGQFSRFLDLSSENADTYGADLGVNYSPSQGESLRSQVGFARLAEDRGDPEARNAAGPGPRLIDDLFATVRYRNEGGRILFDVEAIVRELDAVSAIDDDRDFTSFGGRATVGYRVSGPVYATVTGFATYRDFVLPPTAIDPDRDATTYGGRLGLSFVDNDRIRGRVGVGIFQFDPQDARLNSRSGLSVDASVSLLLDRRSAVVIDAFRGDVATFRAGAQSRTDTRAGVTAQVEMRHNFYGRVGLRYRDTKFVGSGISEETYGPNIAVEFLANRNLALIADASVSERVSDDVFENFERFRVGLTARVRF
ncbi:MAG: outer membrane beta-barrel protein [Pseudomonadota bacterium]